MKILNVKLDIKPKSVNHKLMPSRGRLIINPEYRRYQNELLLQFGNFSDVFEEFRFFYSEKLHALNATWRVYIPEKEFFTKKRTISKTCIDATNTVKIMEDCLVKVLGIDDSQIVLSMVEKIPTNKTTWSVCLELSRVMKPEVVLLDA